MLASHACQPVGCLNRPELCHSVCLQSNRNVWRIVLPVAPSHEAFQLLPDQAQTCLERAKMAKAGNTAAPEAADTHGHERLVPDQGLCEQGRAVQDCHPSAIPGAAL